MKFSIFSVLDHHPDLARTVPELYEQVAQCCELAERLGFYGFFVAEHHFHQYGAVPEPAVFLTALALRTRRIRLGPAICVLPFHHPLTAAERYAMLDVLSHGRLELGVGSGYLKHEFDGFRVPVEEKRGRFDENLALFKRALAGETISHQGAYHRVDNVRLNVLPLQRPTPPIHVAVLRKEAAYHVGRQGNHIVSVPYATVDHLDEVAALVGDFQRGWAEGGHPGSGESLFCFHAHVAETDATARAEASAAFDRYVESRLFAKRQTYDDVLASGLGLFGAPDTVAAKVERLRVMGINHVMLLTDFGALPAERVQASLVRFAEQVAPRFSRP
jgi:alkanesulfonate monooxygenase SsuD/methylene tetrahydromethanopterin reductase-like flavin-dependent oxidoreductase (luciferase family)